MPTYDFLFMPPIFLDTIRYLNMR